MYRDVFLWTGGDVRIEPWDVFVTTKQASESEATVHAAYKISTDYDTDIILRAQILDAEGNCAAIAEVPVTLCKEARTSAELTIRVDKPALWDTENPNLYTLHTEILSEATVLDTDDTTFGIRTISADVKNGFLLNGKPLKLRGGCIHHDHGVLGAADYPAAVNRKIFLLQKAGFNAIRSAHYPPSLPSVEEDCIPDRLL